MLYVVSTPIGNLQDISFRAIETLKSVDYILCEDTRQTRKLLDRYEIQNSAKSFHKFNELNRQDEVIEDLENGKNIALVSDAGTPLIQDPGSNLIAECRKRNIPVTAIPGPCALIAALSMSSFTSSPFQFLGFPPKKSQELTTFLGKALKYHGTSLMYESPERIEKTVAKLAELDPTREIAIAREITKLHEEYLEGTAQEIVAKINARPLKGEIVLLISGKEEEIPEEPSEEDLQKALRLLQEEGLSASQAAKQLAKQYGLSKNDLYQLAHKELSSHNS